MCRVNALTNPDSPAAIWPARFKWKLQGVASGKKFSKGTEVASFFLLPFALCLSCHEYGLIPESIPVILQR